MVWRKDLACLHDRIRYISLYLIPYQNKLVVTRSFRSFLSCSNGHERVFYFRIRAWYWCKLSLQIYLEHGLSLSLRFTGALAPYFVSTVETIETLARARARSDTIGTLARASSDTVETLARARSDPTSIIKGSTSFLCRHGENPSVLQIIYFSSPFKHFRIRYNSLNFRKPLPSLIIH